MREIKFRVWNKGEKAFEEHALGMGTDGKLITNHNDDFELCQFTGLTDKNGKEIYEGDCFGGIWEHHSVGWCAKQVAFQGFNCLHECGSCNGDFQLDEMIDEEGGVIGNIYQNPELVQEAA